MSENLKKTIKYILSIAGACLLLWVSFKGVDWGTFWQGLKSCRWGFVILSMLVGVWSFLFRGFRWRQLLYSIDSKTKLITCFNAVNISYVANMILPRVGELIRCGYVTKHSQLDANGKRLASYDKVLGTVVVDRLWDVLTLIAVCLIIIVFMWKRVGYFFTNKILGSSISDNFHLSFSWLLVAGLILLTCFIVVVIIFRKTNKICAKIYNVFKGIVLGMVACFKAKGMWKTFSYSILVWIGYWLTSYCILLAVQGIDPSIFSAELRPSIVSLSSLGVFDALFLMMMGALSSLIPVPGGFGAFHYFITMSLSVVYGIPPEIGIIFATLTHESQALIQIICGGLSYAYETIK